MLNPNISLKTRKYINKGKRHKPHKKWFTKECMVTKNRLSRLASQMKRFPFDRNWQSRYRSLCYEYKTLIRKAARSYDTSLKSKLLSVERNDPKSFWNLISNIKEESKDDDDEMTPNEFSKGLIT